MSINYRRYLMSAEWQKRKRQRMGGPVADCEQCGRPGTRQTLQLHHRSYERLGNEDDNDLILLCLECHRLADRERRRLDPKHEQRVRNWAKRRYGSAWESTMPYDLVEERYQSSKETLNRY